MIIALIALLLLLTLVIPYLRWMHMGVPIYATMPVAALILLKVVCASKRAWHSMHRMGIFFLLFLIALTVSTWWQMINLGAWTYSSYAALSRGLAAFMLPAVVVGLSPRMDKLSLIIRLWAYFGGIVGLWAVLQVVAPFIIDPIDRFYYFEIAKIAVRDELQGRSGYSTARGIAGVWNANVAGAILALCLPFGLEALRRGSRLLGMIAVSLILAGVVATGSRQAIGGVLVALCIFFISKTRSKTAVVDRIGMGRIFVALSLIAVLGLIAYQKLDFGREQFGRIEEKGLVSGAEARAEGYNNFLHYALSDPLGLLIGAGPAAGEIGSRAGSSTWGEGFVSNSWLLILLEFGILGLISFVGMFVIAWRSAYQPWAKACLATLAWLMMCDNAMHVLFCTQVIVSLCLAMAVLSGREMLMRAG